MGTARSGQADYAALCVSLLKGESEEDVARVLDEAGLLDPKYWKPLGGIPNNRSIVNNQQQDPTGAMVEKIINSIDAMLTKECFLHGILPDSTAAPSTMAQASERFFGIKEGNLANLLPTELTRLAENIQVVATGSKADPCYLIIDKGEGQTPARFEDTFLSLVKSNKIRIPFVQGKFNVGGTGVLPFCGSSGFQLVISRRCPALPSDPLKPGQQDPTHSFWGFTVVRKLPASAGLYDTMVYVYLAPNGEIPRFESRGVPGLPEVNREEVGEDAEPEQDVEAELSSGKPIPKAYRKELDFGTVVKLYGYRWKARSLATRDVRYELEKDLFRLSLPIRVVETRVGYRANYYATTVAGTSVTIAKDREKGRLEQNFPTGGEINPEGVGRLPIQVVLYRERNGAEGDAKAPKRIPRGLKLTVNGQAHFTAGPEFFMTRGLNYGYIKDTLFVTADCTMIPPDVRDQLIMPSRDRLRKLPEFDSILDGIVGDLKDRDTLRSINDERRLRRVQEALSQDGAKNVLQSLIAKDPVFASLFRNGKGLRNPLERGLNPPDPVYRGKLPPTYFRFEGGKNEIVKSFAIDRTCAVELETDAVNGYFELPNPFDRGTLTIDPATFDRWNLSNGELRIVFRAPSNARIGDTMNVKITVTDPHRAAAGDQPWINTVRLIFGEGGKEVRSGGRKRGQKETGSLAMPSVTEIFRSRWSQFNFNDKSALEIIRSPEGSHDFFINMDNTYLLNELVQRKEPEKEAAKFAYKWGLVLVALGMLQAIKPQGQAVGEPAESGNGDEAPEAPEKLVSQFSSGVAAVIVPIVLNLMEAMTEDREAALRVRN